MNRLLADRTALAAAVLVWVVACPAEAAGAHAHGVARLNVAVDAATITLQLTSPLESLLGFERAPKSDAERARVREMAQALRAGEAFAPSAAARCRLERTDLVAPVLPAELLAAAPAAPAPTADEHADLDATFVYRCENMAALTGIEVRLFDRFKRLERIDGQLAGPKGQSALKLTPRARQIRW